MKARKIKQLTMLFVTESDASFLVEYPLNIRRLEHATVYHNSESDIYS